MVVAPPFMMDFIFAYDEKGNLIKKSLVYDGKEDYSFTYTYDEYGNVIKKVYKDRDGAVETKEVEYKLVFVSKEVTEQIEKVYGFDYY